MTREEFIKKYRKTNAWMYAAVLGPIVVSALALLALVKWLEVMETSLTVVLVAGVATTLVVCAAAICGIRFAEKRFPWMRCQKCGKILGDFTRNTGKCHACGEWVFDPPTFPPDHTFTPLEHETVVAFQRKWNQRCTRALLLALAVFVTGFIALSIDDFFNNRSMDCHTKLSGIVFGASMLVFMGFVVWLASASEIKCPNCKKSTPLAACMRLVITRTCNHCGKEVVLPRKDDAEDAAFTREEWEARYKACRRWCVLPCLWIATPLIPIFAKQAGMGVPGRAALLAALLALLVVQLLHRRRNVPCPCPQCGESLSHPVQFSPLLASGRCPYCGGKVVVDKSIKT